MSNLRFDRLQPPHGQNRLATAALALGIITFLLSFIPYLVLLTWLPSLLALTFGIVSGIRSPFGRKKAASGAILGFTGFWLGALITALVASGNPSASPAITFTPQSSISAPAPTPSFTPTPTETGNPTPTSAPTPSYAPSATPSPSASSQAPAAPEGRVSAVTLLARLLVKPEVTSGYDRAKFRLWVDANGNGHDTRAEVLASQSEVPVTYTSSGAVASGRWRSPYDGLTFTQGGDLDVDHMVPLGQAWASGANTWNAERREAYANDLGYGASLIAVSAHENRSKSDSDPTGYLPPLATYRCTYVKNWVAIKFRWKLTVDAAEKSTLTNLLRSCSNPYVTRPGEPKLSELTGSSSSSSNYSSNSGSGSSNTSGSSDDSGSSSTGSTDGTSGKVDTRYDTCSELLQHANSAPYIKGSDPEYGWYQDRDHDGRVCE